MVTPVAEGHGYRRVDRVVTEDLTIVFRVIAAVAAAVLIVFGVTALVRIDWDPGGFDAPAVKVADVTFTPVVAISAAAAGLLALLAAATSDRTSKIVVGALLVCAGIVAFIARPDDSSRVILEDAHGWLLIAAGGVLIVTAVAMSWGASRRVVDRSAVYD